MPDRFETVVTKLGHEVDTRLRDMGDGTHAHVHAVEFPNDLYSANNGQGRRLRVDNAQTGFFTGREFRSFFVFDIAQGGSAYIKWTTQVDWILRGFDVQLSLGNIKVELLSDGTTAGNFNTALPIRPTNAMSTAPANDSLTTLLTGGTVSGATREDIFYASSGTNIQKAVFSSGSETDPLGFPSGDVYIWIQNISTGAAQGVLHTRWEERP